MTAHRDALEALNRATFDPPTPELCAAEELQPVDRMTPREIICSIPAQDFVFGMLACGLAYLFAAGIALIAP